MLVYLHNDSVSQVGFQTEYYTKQFMILFWIWKWLCSLSFLLTYCCHLFNVNWKFHSLQKLHVHHYIPIKFWGSWLLFKPSQTAEIKHMQIANIIKRYHFWQRNNTTTFQKENTSFCGTHKSKSLAKFVYYVIEHDWNNHSYGYSIAKLKAS